MSPNALSGEGGAYAPCFELPAALPAVPAGAIVGHGVGFVPRNVSAAGLPGTPHGAVVGSEVGFVPGICCPWVWQNGFDDGAFASGRWDIGSNETGCLLSLDVAADAGTDDMVIFELPETAETADAYASIRAGVTLTALIYVPFRPTNTEPPEIGDPTEETGCSISVFARDDPNTVTTRIDAAFRLFTALIPGETDNALIDLTMFGKRSQTFFPSTVGFHTLTLSISPDETIATLDGNIAYLNQLFIPSLRPPIVDMDSLAQLRVRMGENTTGFAGIFTAQPSLP